MPLLEVGGGSIRADRHSVQKGKPEIDIATDTAKPHRRDADNRGCNAVESYCGADHLGIGPKPISPDPMTDHSHRFVHAVLTT